MQDYVQKGVNHWGAEANTVEAVCGRFRDLLTLRQQLLQKLHQELQVLHKVRGNRLTVVQVIIQYTECPGSGVPFSEKNIYTENGFCN